MINNNNKKIDNRSAKREQVMRRDKERESDREKTKGIEVQGRGKRGRAKLRCLGGVKGDRQTSKGTAARYSEGRGRKEGSG